MPCVSRGVSSGHRQRNNLVKRESEGDAHQWCWAAGTAEKPGHLCLLAYSWVWFGKAKLMLPLWQALQDGSPSRHRIRRLLSLTPSTEVCSAHYGAHLLAPPLLHILQKSRPSAETIPGTAQLDFTCGSKSCEPDIVPGKKLLEEVLVRAALSEALLCQQKHRGGPKSIIACKD